ncbi:MAG: phosphoglycerate kinase [Microgenomates group bacterium]
MGKIKYIDEVEIKNKKVIIRVDYNISLKEDSTIADDTRIRQSLPTIEYLLKNQNRLILISHLGRPKGKDPTYSLKPVVQHLKKLLPENKIILIDDFLNEKNKPIFEKQKSQEIIVLENIRFYPEEKNNNENFARKLAQLGDVFINDAFAVCHRTDTSVVGITKFLPSYGGLLLKKEIKMLGGIMSKPKKPLVAIIGGAKISTKLPLLYKLTELADYLLIGGGLANTFFCAQGLEIGQSFCEYEQVANARKLLFHAAQKNTAVILPSDVVIGDPKNSENGGQVKKIFDLPAGAIILDIGPETQAKFGAIINKAKTIIWNGPVGFFENPSFRRGTDFIYYAITQNQQAISIVGGGDTLAAISKKEYLDKITHISTGGGAMLEYIEKGTLPGIEALKF